MPIKDLEEQAKKRNPLGRFGKHEELENLAAYLISDQSEFINGEFITMNGSDLL